MMHDSDYRKQLNAHGRDVIRSCLNIVEQHGDTYVAIHRDDDTECIILVSLLRSYPLLSIIVADRLLLAERNDPQILCALNSMNADSVTGWHCVFLENDSVIYMYRQCVWLSMDLTYDDLLWLLKECISDYKDGKSRIITDGAPADHAEEPPERINS